MNGHGSTVRLLVEALGADMEAKGNAKRTPLHLAATKSHDSTVRLLVETLGADTEARGPYWAADE
jgi:ankyrin repeat protein